MKNSYTQDFVDEKGNRSELIITSEGSAKINLKSTFKKIFENPYKLF